MQIRWALHSLSSGLCSCCTRVRPAPPVGMEVVDVRSVHRGARNAILGLDVDGRGSAFGEVARPLTERCMAEQLSIDSLAALAEHHGASLCPYKLNVSDPANTVMFPDA